MMVMMTSMMIMMMIMRLMNDDVDDDDEIDDYHAIYLNQYFRTPLESFVSSYYPSLLSCL